MSLFHQHRHRVIFSVAFQLPEMHVKQLDREGKGKAVQLPVILFSAGGSLTEVLCAFLELNYEKVRVNDLESRTFAKYWL